MHLLNANAELEVEGILKPYEDKQFWVPLGDNIDNLSTVENQQTGAEAALAEKIVNGIDAILIKECLIRRIDPSSDEAPKTMFEAVEKFFGVPGGELENITPEKRAALANNLILVASGNAGRAPCLSVLDQGEGVTPREMKDTLLSLPGQGKREKSQIQFVQGVYNQGGTGVLRFCGSRKYQLMISKRHPSLANSADDSSGKWGFTVVRKRLGGAGRKSLYEYLAPGKEIPSFYSDSLPLMPGERAPEAHTNPVLWGTFVKLFDYEVGSTIITLDLTYELQRHFVRMALPARVCERRVGFERTRSPFTYLAGMKVRLCAESESRSVLEPDFIIPSGIPLQVADLGTFNVEIYLFKQYIERAGDIIPLEKSRWMGTKPIMLVLNGQTHTFVEKESIFSRKVCREAGLGYIEESVMLIVDCSGLELSSKEALLFPSRDRVATEKLEAIKRELASVLSVHPGLQLHAKKRQQELERKRTEETELKDTLKEVLNDEPSLASLFGLGTQPLPKEDFDWKKWDRPYTGKFVPTFCRIAKRYRRLRCPVGKSCHVYFETDAENDYFTRTRQPGSITARGITGIEYRVTPTLWNGWARFRMRSIEQIPSGSRVRVKVVVSDAKKRFENDVLIRYYTPKSQVSPANRLPRGTNKPVVPDERGRHKVYVRESTEAPLNLPEINTLSEEEWLKSGFDSNLPLKIKDAQGGKIEIYINSGFEPYKRAVGGQTTPSGMKKAKRQYNVGLAVATLGMMFKLEEGSNSEDVRDKAERAARGLSYVMLPLLRSLK